MAGRNVSLERFRTLTNDLKREVMAEARTALGEQAARLVGVMKSAVPVDSGKLRDSIDWCFGDPPKTRATGAFRPKPVGQGRQRVCVFAGNDQAFYARWVEFGTAPHSLAKGADVSRNKRQRRGKQHPGTAAHPFFWPTFRLLRKSMTSAITRRVGSAIKKRWQDSVGAQAA